MRQLRLTKSLDKRGSYILEAVIVMPVFIAAVVALMSLVPVAATCENMVFAAADEMRLESVKSAFRQNRLALPSLAKQRIRRENPKISSYQTVFYRYLLRGRRNRGFVQSVFLCGVFSEEPGRSLRLGGVLRPGDGKNFHRKAA